MNNTFDILDQKLIQIVIFTTMTLTLTFTCYLVIKLMNIQQKFMKFADPGDNKQLTTRTIYYIKPLFDSKHSLVK